MSDSMSETRRMVEEFATSVRQTMTTASKNGRSPKHQKELEEALKTLVDKAHGLITGLRLENGWDWDNIQYRDAETVMRANHSHVPGILRATIETMTPVAYIAGSDVASAVLKCERCNQYIDTTMFGDPILTQLQSLRRKQSVIDVLGFSVNMPGGMMTNKNMKQKPVHRKTGITWTERTWNPAAGCSKVSPGCANCYAILDAWRMTTNSKIHSYDGTACKTKDGRLEWTGKVNQLPDKLEEPLRIRQPHLIFVNSMSDLFHDNIRVEFILKVFQVMQKAHWHNFQVLTKRAERLLKLSPLLPWPRNVWMGVTVETNDFLNRVDLLRQTRAKVKWISAEPLLGPLPDLDLEGIDWMVIGGETKKGAREMEEQWALDIVSKCQSARVPVHMKQMGAVWAKKHNLKGDMAAKRDMSLWPAQLRVREYPTR